MSESLREHEIRVPRLVGELFARLPQYPPSLLVAAALNILLAETITEGELDGLRGKLVRIRVIDAGLTFSFALEARGFLPRADSGEAALTISACTYDFAKIAFGRVDPDTLFFSRRLCVEGDTDLGLLAKNTFERMDLRERVKHSLNPATFMTRLLRLKSN
jgi:O2-independent ubiquinone biosynthesis accessory factor UbiT